MRAGLEVLVGSSSDGLEGLIGVAARMENPLSRAIQRLLYPRKLLVVAFLIAEGALAQVAGAPSATKADGVAYPVSELVLDYVDPNPQFPPVSEIAQIEVEVGQVADGLSAPRATTPLVRFRISELPKFGTQKIYGSAIAAINQQIVFEFNRRDFHAIVVAPMPDDIDPDTRRDVRPPGRTQLRLGVFAGRVRDLRTYATGGRIGDQEERVDRPEHAWIKKGSPIQPTAPDDLVRKDQLDAYLARLNRHPSRRVDAEISPAETAGGVNLDYMVAENKPWWAYTQVEDTGTAETTDLRERFGFVHTQLSGHDDILQLDYITGNFDEVHAAVASYEIPWKRGSGSRTRVFGSWSQYDASVFGFANSFHGDQATGGAQAIVNVAQLEELFVDAVVGLQYDHVEVVNDLGGTRGDSDFAIGVFGGRVQRLGLISTLVGEVSILHNFGGLANTDGSDLSLLGRFDVTEEDFTLVRWDLDYSFFIAPALSPRSWRDPSILRTKSLAHEMLLSFRGQNAFGNRLIPQQEFVVGGLHTVRGYPEAAAVGDNVEVYGLEYQLHLPRLLKPGGEPVRMGGVGQFRARPQYDYTFPDWDLIGKAFLDIAQVGHVKPDSSSSQTEDPETLIGVGVGMELRVQRYLSARVDYGIALKKVELNDGKFAEKGDGEVHFSVTLLY
jgi:hemolysin activation/secretion protein